MSTAKYFDFITIAKGFAIVCVVLGHFTPDYMPEVYRQLKEAVYVFHMPLFMLLAGFLFQNSLSKHGGRIDVFPFIKKKFMRLMVPYFFLSFSIAALNGCLQQFMPVKKTVDVSYLVQMLYENVGGSATFLWFLYTLFMIFTITVILMQWPKGHLLMLVVACVLFFIPLPPVFYLDSIGKFYVYFAAGAFFYSYYDSHFVSSFAWAIALAILFVLILLSRSCCTVSWIHMLLTLLCSLSACLLILYISRKISGTSSRPVSLLKTAGKDSSYIYLLHMAGVYPIRLLYEHLGWYSHVSYGIFLVLAIVAGCFLPILASRYIIKRYGVLQFLMGDSKKNK